MIERCNYCGNIHETNEEMYDGVVFNPADWRRADEPQAISNTKTNIPTNPGD